jgi:hypothetical protein
VECGGLPPLFLRLQFPAMTEKFERKDKWKTSESGSLAAALQNTKRPDWNRSVFLYGINFTRVILHLSRETLVIGQNGLSDWQARRYGGKENK